MTIQEHEESYNALSKELKGHTTDEIYRDVCTTFGVYLMYQSKEELARELMNMYNSAWKCMDRDMCIDQLATLGLLINDKHKAGSKNWSHIEW